MVLRIGTDCSGIEAPIQALRKLQIPHEHVFSSEIDKYTVESIKANYSPCCMYGDISYRDNNLLSYIDLYVCSFPYQPFFINRPSLDIRNKKCNIFWKCIDVIKVKNPKFFILESIKGILSNDDGRTWKIILTALHSLEKYGYVVKYRVLNTRNFGIPQNRERVYIVGYKSDTGIEFQWPSEKKMEDIKNYVDWENTIQENTISKSVQDRFPKESVFINPRFTQTAFSNTHMYCPSITSGSGQIWCVPLGRYASPRELLWLQGFPKDFKQVVSNTQLTRQIGNSMSVNVLCSLLENLISI